MTTLAQWIDGARPRTLPAAVAPVAVGTGAAFALREEAVHGDAGHLGFALLALVVALALQVGVNYANDYSDGIRGTDDDRTGPTRLTGSGLAKPEHVKLAAFMAFGAAAVFGVVLSAMAGAMWLVLVGALCIAAAWFYTGGESPYGYSGLGEVSVFIFFGLVAVMGTEYTQSGLVTWEGFLCALAIGAISASVNLANNIRDIPTDAAAGKRTLAVRLGDDRSRTLFTVLTLFPFFISLVLSMTTVASLAALVALPLAAASVLKVRGGASGKELIPVLGMNGKTMLAWAVVTAVAFAWFGWEFWGGAGEAVPYTAEV